MSTEVAPKPQTGPMKFAYASGSRPLDGYTIKRGVGGGGFGEVYYATSDGGKDVALKLIRRNLDIELRGVRQCLNLTHPNLLELYDVRQDSGGDSWVIMQYMQGDCLENVLASHPHGLDEAEARRWFAGIAAAVAYLHDHGIVHRDLKPGNIFQDEGLIKLGDYGLSKFISVSRRSGQTESVGTVHYMAPEIANGRYGKEIDLYALGILLYELLTGHVPFEGESVGEVLMKHLTAEPDLKRLPEAYRPLVRACLAKDPQQRPGSVTQLLALLPGSLVTPGQPPMPLQQRAAGAALNARAGSGPALGPTAAVEIWSRLSTQAKMLALFVVVYVLLRSTPGQAEAVLLAAGAAFFYLLFGTRLFRRVAPAGMSAPTAERAIAPVAYHRPPPAVLPPVSPPASVSLAPPELTRSPRDRVMELSGSMLLAAGVAAATVVVALSVRGVTPESEQFTWQLAVSTLGAWLVLVPAKLWEGAKGDDWVRRFVMLLMGLLLGASAWGLDQWLWVNLNYGQPLVPSMLHIGQTAYEPDGQPRILAYLAYFGLLLAVPRWWRQADPLRRKRVSISTIAFCAVCAVALNQLCSFPQPWALLTAGTMSLAVQLASPCRPNERTRSGRVLAGNVRHVDE